MNLEKYHLSNGPCIKPGPFPGEKAKLLLTEQEMFESNNRSYPRAIPLVPKIAKGTIVEDVDGNQFMDFFSMCGVVNVGHNNEIVLDAIQDQIHQLIHSMDFPTEVKIDFMRNLNNKLPKGFKDDVKINFCGPTGADGVEAAVKLARIYSKRNLVISFQGAYHGMTTGALSLTSNLKNRKELPFLNQGTHFAPYSYCYRCPFGKRPDSCNIECAVYVRTLLENPHSGVDKPAAILLEPVQGEGGAVVPRKEFHKELRKICDDHSVVLIHDEVQVGFYRTGELLCSENFDVIPDIAVMSKGIGGVGMPIAILLLKKSMDVWTAGTHAGTFRGNQLSIAAGNAAIQFINEYKIKDHVRDMGALLLEELNTIKDRSQFIGDVRGLGLIVGVEYVRNKNTKVPFAEICLKLRSQLFLNGIIIEIGGHYSNVIRILPPLVTTRGMIVEFIRIFDRVNEEIEQEYKPRPQFQVNF